MYLWDEKFKENKERYVYQCVLASFIVFILLLFLDAKENSAIISALGASSFIVFTMPDRVSSMPRFLIGGYIMGIISGILIKNIFLLLSDMPPHPLFMYGIFGAMAVGLSIFLMVVTNTEHPPAAGLALALIINDWTFITLLVVLTGVISLTVAKSILRPVLMDLL